MLDLNKKHYDIHNIDIEAGEKTAKNLIRARGLNVATALKKIHKTTSLNLIMEKEK